MKSLFKKLSIFVVLFQATSTFGGTHFGHFEEHCGLEIMRKILLPTQAARPSSFDSSVDPMHDATESGDFSIGGVTGFDIPSADEAGPDSVSDIL